MKYCPDCMGIFPFDDALEEQECPECGATLEDIDLFMETPCIYCSACGTDGLENYELQTLDDADEIYLCPECGAIGTLKMEEEE